MPGYECRHNKNYWNHSNYLSFGPSAHSFWKDGTTNGTRWWNVRSIAQYHEAISGGSLPVAGSETVDKGKMFDEAIFLGLRTGELSIAMLQQLYGVDLMAAHGTTLKTFSDEELLTVGNRSIRLTRKGFLMCDAIAEALLH